MKKLLFSCLIGLLLMFASSGCTEFQSRKAEMYDDDTAIVSDADSYFTSNSLLTSTSKYEVDFSFGSFSGTKTIWVIRAETGGVFTVNYKATVTEDALKMVLIDPDKNVQIIFENSSSGEQTFNLDEGKYVIKLVGRYAQGDIELTMKDYQNINVSNLLSN